MNLRMHYCFYGERVTRWVLDETSADHVTERVLAHKETILLCLQRLPLPLVLLLFLVIVILF